MSSCGGLISRLAKTRQNFSSGLIGIFKRNIGINENLYEEIEDQLLMADLGVQTSQKLIDKLKSKAKQSKYEASADLLQGLKECIMDILIAPLDTAIELENDEIDNALQVVLMVGVNGVGKTTTLAKAGNYYKQCGHSVMFAAADTFRAAAIEQLQTWGDRLNIPVIAQSHGADAAAVAYDAYSAAKARNIDILFVDSAGRQHTHGDLMDQLGKIKRVLGKDNPDCPQQVWLTVDAGNGQNVISQVENFSKVIPLTGLCVTKLDGTARGGVIIALVEKYNLPIKFIGVGEGAEDLRQFDADEFVQALLPELSE